MTENQKRSSAWQCTAWLLAAVLLGGACSTLAAAQQPGTLSPAIAKAQRAHAEEAEEKEAQQPPAKPGVESVRVHGHWIIDVRDKDGKLVEHRDFQNSLLDTGNELLTSLLTGGFSAAYPFIALSGSGLSTLIMVPDPVDCAYTHISSPDCGSDLQMSAGASGLTFTADAATSANVNVDAVTTAVYRCPLSSPASCSLMGNRAALGLTQATLGTPLKLSVGQSIHVQVALTFN